MTEPIWGAKLTAGDRARLLRQAVANPAAASRPARIRPRPDLAPASYAQEQLWFLDQLAPATANYNVPFAFDLDGPLDLAALRQALAGTVARHDSLRTALCAGPGGLRQVVAPTVELPLSVVDTSPGDDQLGEARRRARVLAAEPFALDQAPLWRAVLIRAGSNRHLLVWVASHAVADGWSVGLLLRDLVEGYRVVRRGGPDLRPEPAMQFTEYASQQRESLTAPRIAELVEYWRIVLQDCPELEFPFDHPRPEQAATRGATHTFPVPADLVGAVRETARRLGVTSFAILLAAYHALLARYCAANDIAVGTPVAGRGSPAYDDLLGSLVNTVVIRMDSSDDPTFASFVSRTADVTAGALAHQDLPFGLLVEHLRPRRDGRYNPLCQTVFSFGSTPHTDHEYTLEAGTTVRPVGISNGTVRFDLELAIDDGPEGWTGRLEYATDLLQDASAQRLCDRYLGLLRAALVEPQRRLSHLMPPPLDQPVAGQPAPNLPGVPVRRNGPEVARAITSWLAGRRDHTGQPYPDPLALCEQAGVTTEQLPGLLVAAQRLADQVGLAPGSTVDLQDPFTGARLLFAVLLGVAAADGPPHPSPRRCLVADPAAAAAPAPASLVVLLAERPGLAPPWAVSASQAWQVTLAPAVPGAVLTQRVRSAGDHLLVGHPLPGTRAELLDRAGRPALPGTVGYLRLSGVGTTAHGAPAPGWRVHQLDDGTLACPGRALPVRRPRADPPAVDHELVGYLLSVWREALGAGEVGPDDDFFALGGHSLLAGNVVARIRDDLGCEFTLVEFFQTLTVREVSGLLAGRGAQAPTGHAATSVSLDLLRRVEEMPDDEVARLLQRTGIAT